MLPRGRVRIFRVGCRGGHQIIVVVRRTKRYQSSPSLVGLLSFAPIPGFYCSNYYSNYNDEAPLCLAAASQRRRCLFQSKPVCLSSAGLRPGDPPVSVVFACLLAWTTTGRYYGCDGRTRLFLWGERARGAWPASVLGLCSGRSTGQVVVRRAVESSCYRATRRRRMASGTLFVETGHRTTIPTPTTTAAWIPSHPPLPYLRLSPYRAAASETALSMKYTLVLLRHGESTWNKENRFTGWVDCPLSEEGEAEASKGVSALVP
jgi:hypothetical protein